jgi:hypothetical protein
LYAEETLRIIFKIKVGLDMQQLSRNMKLKCIGILNSSENSTTEYELKVGGGIYLEWGECGKYHGSAKSCNV